MTGPAARATGAAPTPTPSLRRRATLAVTGVFAALLVIVGGVTDITLGAQLGRELETRLIDRAFRAEAFSEVGYTPEQLPDLLAGRGIRVLVTGPDGATYGDAGLAPFVGPVAPATTATAAPTATESEPGTDTEPEVTQPPPPEPGPRGPKPGGPARPVEPPPRPGPAANGSEDPRIKTPSQPALPPPPAESSTTRVVDLSNGARVLLVADTTEIDDIRNELRLIMIAAGVAALALATLVLGLVVPRALAPLTRLTGVARAITGGDRGRRLLPDRAETELGQAGVAFDGMLDALEASERKSRQAAADATAAASTAQLAETATRGFLSDAAHELRTPLAGIQVTAEQLADGAADDPRQRRRADLLLAETARASRLVGDMLDLARIDAAPALEVRDTDLTGLVADHVERAVTLSPSLHISHTPADVVATIDPVRVGQIVTNLLNNARRHTPDGGSITVAVDHRDGETAPLAEITVTDTGPGIPEDQRERIFQRLVRLADARDRDSGGAGLGLPIARALARAHGGDVKCVPHTGGARFVVSLPIGPTDG